MTEKLGLWLILDVFFRLMTLLVVISILVADGFWRIILIIIFIFWAFRPGYLAFKDFKKDMEKKPKKQPKLNKEKRLLILKIIFWIVFVIGFILFINRSFFQVLPSENWRVLLDHLVGGFLVTTLFYIFLLGFFSFFKPKRKIIYGINWFILASAVTFLGSFYWEGLVQNFRDIGQITADYFGLLFSWIYFLIYRRVQNEK